MRVTAGERAVHISMTYDQADALLARLTPGEELYAKLALNVPAGRAKGEAGKGPTKRQGRRCRGEGRRTRGGEG